MFVLSLFFPHIFYFSDSRGLSFVIVAFSGYFHLHMCSKWKTDHSGHVADYSE